MQVNIVNMSSFKGIEYNPDKKYFNKSQIKAAENLISKFKEIDTEDKKHRSYEDVYKQLGYEFVIEPDNKKENANSVKLYALFGCCLFNQNKDIKDYYHKKIHMGSYQYENNFCAKDFKYIINEEQNKLIGCLSNLLIPFVILIGMLFGSDLKNKKIEKIEKQTVTVVQDSLKYIKQECKTVLPTLTMGK